MIDEEEFRSVSKGARSIEAMFLVSTHSWRRGVKNIVVVRSEEMVDGN